MNLECCSALNSGFLGAGRVLSICRAYWPTQKMRPGLSGRGDNYAGQETGYQLTGTTRLELCAGGSFVPSIWDGILKQ